jgi:predicted permease
MTTSARENRTLPTIDSIRQDLRYTFRALVRDRAFTTFAVLIVGLGIGASSTVFSIIDTLLVRPLPFHDSGWLVWIVNHNGEDGDLSGATTQVGHFLDLREQNQSFSDVAAYYAFYGVGDNKLTGQGEPERLSGVPVSENFFQLLGVQPELGRLFTEEECKPNGPKAVLLGHGLWVRLFGSNPGIVGRALRLNDEPVTVVGVLPASFDFASVFAPGSHIDLYYPFPMSAETNRWGNTLAMIGRLKPGVALSTAQAEATILSKRLTEAHRKDRNDFEARLSFLGDHVRGRMRSAMIVLACAVGVVMLIVCANLSNLLLARTATRQKEIAIRTALGAARGRLIRQMLTESVVLSCCGATIGALLEIAGVKAMARLDAIRIPLLENVRVDASALGFTLLTAVLTGLIFGLVPAIQIPSGGLYNALKDTSRGSTLAKGRAWIRGALVVSEIAFACVLLVGAGLLIRSFLRVLDVNLGFQPERAVAVRVDPSQRHPTQAQQNAYFDEVLRLARDIPGVAVAGLTDELPLGRNRSWGAGAKGHIYRDGGYPDAFVRIVSDGYLKAMGIPLIAGRDLSERDTNSSEPVILINQTMARRIFPGENAIGQIVIPDRERRIVGIVSDVRHIALEQGAGSEMYIPIRQTQDYDSADLVLRTTLPPAQLAAAVRNTLQPIAHDLPISDFRTIQHLVDKAVSPRRFIVMLLGGFALFALILASLGIYGVISYSVNQRKQEIGIRMALGASAGNLQSRIILQTLSLAGIGMLVGATASWILARALSGLLYGITPTDPITFLGMVIVLTAVAALAGYLPARRASRIDPMAALRAD